MQARKRRLSAGTDFCRQKRSGRKKWERKRKNNLKKKKVGRTEKISFLTIKRNDSVLQTIKFCFSAKLWHSMVNSKTSKPERILIKIKENKNNLFIPLDLRYSK